MDNTMILALFPILADATQAAGAASQLTIPEVLSSVCEFITAIVSIVAVTIAHRGLTTWQDQLKGKTEYDLARRLLRAAFRTRDALSSVRDSDISHAEVDQALKSACHTDANDASFDPRKAVYSQRWRAVTEALSDLDVERLEAETIWTPEVLDALKPLQDCVSKLRWAILRLLSHHTAIREHRPSPLKDEALEELDSILHETSPDPAKNPFTDEIHKATAKLAEFLKPKLIR